MLDLYYDSKNTNSKIAKILQLVSIRFTSVRNDMEKHLDRMTALIKQMKSMNTTLDDALDIKILVAYIDVTQLLPVTAAIKSSAEF